MSRISFLIDPWNDPYSGKIAATREGNGKVADLQVRLVLSKLLLFRLRGLLELVQGRRGAIVDRLCRSVDARAQRTTQNDIVHAHKQRLLGAQENDRENTAALPSVSLGPVLMIPHRRWVKVTAIYEG